MLTNIVISSNNIRYFKVCKFFQQNLGFVITTDKNGQRQLSDKDKFSYFYNTQYNTQIFAQGNIGNIKLYVDYGITDDSIAVYFGNTFDEHILQFDRELYNAKGVEFYIGHILKTVEEKHEERKLNNELKKLEPVPVGNPNAVLNNPGNVTYADIKAYLQMKEKSRYENK